MFTIHSKNLLPILLSPHGRRLPFLITFILPTVRAGAIVLVPLRPVRDANIPDLIADLHPALAAAGDGADLAEGPIGQAGDDEAGEEVDVVDVFRARGDGFADGADEADDVDEDAADVGRVAAPVEAEGEVVRGGFAGRVEVSDLVVAAADDVVIADDDACDRGEEDGVGG